MFFIFFFHFAEEKVSSFLFSCISFKYFFLLASVSEFNCFLRSRCSMEMWCPDDIGRDSWDWVGPPAWGRACFNSPEWGGGSSPVKTEPPQIVLLLLLLTQIDEPAMPVSTQLNDLIGNSGAESPGSKLPATPAPPAPVTDTGAPKNPVPDHATQPVKLVKRTSSEAKCEPRKAKLQSKHRLGTLLHSNRMEEQRFRNRVRRHVENV